MLEIRDLVVHYGLSQALHGMTLTLAPGECLAVLGRNGMGKTTLLRAIAGWIAPSAGSITFEGREIAGLAPETICRLGIGFVPEDRRIFPGLTVEENVRLGLHQRPNRSRAERMRALEATWTRFPWIAERRAQMGHTLSGGEQQMLAIARVLVGDPRLLLIDEPTEGLAPQVAGAIYDLLAGLKREGRAILLVEQNVRRAFDLADRMVAVERGRIVLEGRAASETDRAALLAAIAV